MSEVKFTPGPWRVSTKREFKHTSDDYHQIVALDGPRTNGPGFTITGCIGIADAKLIAAAPELLEALIRISNCNDLATAQEYAREAIKSAIPGYKSATE